MIKRNNINIDEADQKRIDKYKISPYEPYWLVIKRILDEKEVKKK